MKAYFLLLLFIIGTACHADADSFDEYQQRQLAYIAQIKYATSKQKPPPISCLYHGSALMCKEGFCRLPEDQLRTFFSLIITPRIEFTCKGSTRCMSRVKGLPCKWYNLTLRFVDDAKKKTFYTWKIQELNPKNRPLRLPDHASIVVELNPDFIKKLEPPIKTGPNAIKLPTVVLKDSVLPEELEDALIKIAAQAPERNINCTKPYDITQKYGNSTLLKKQVQ
jgi:hypothetical protein